MGCGMSKASGAEVLTSARIDDPDHPRGLSSGRLIAIEPGQENESAMALQNEVLGSVAEAAEAVEAQ